MNEQTDEISRQVKEHLQHIDVNAEVILLFPAKEKLNEEIQLYVVTPEKVSFEKEQHYFKACYQLELNLKQNLSVYIYTKESWHKQLVNTPIYTKVSKEGIYL
jgi:hypothetical protein